MEPPDPEHTREPSSESVVDELVEAFGEVVGAVQGLREGVQAEVESKRKLRTWVTLACALVSLLVILQLGALYEAREGREQLLDCTTPEGKCFQEGQERQAVVVNGMICILADEPPPGIDCAPFQAAEPPRES